MLAAQVLGAFLWVVRRRRPDRYVDALELVQTLPRSIVVPSSTSRLIAEAGRLALRHHLQFWDALIIVTSEQAGATHLVSEDMHDGSALAGITIINPFEPANRSLLDRLLPPEVHEL